MKQEKISSSSEEEMRMPHAGPAGRSARVVSDKVTGAPQVGSGSTIRNTVKFQEHPTQRHTGCGGLDTFDLYQRVFGPTGPSSDNFA